MDFFRVYSIEKTGLEELLSFGLPLDKDYLHVEPITFDEVLMAIKDTESPAGGSNDRAEN